MSENIHFHMKSPWGLFFQVYCFYRRKDSATKKQLCLWRQPHWAAIFLQQLIWLVQNICFYKCVSNGAISTFFFCTSLVWEGVRGHRLLDPRTDSHLFVVQHLYMSQHLTGPKIRSLHFDRRGKICSLILNMSCLFLMCKHEQFCV